MIETSLFLGIPFGSTFKAVSFFHSSVKDEKKIRGYNRVGPHHRDIISIIFGSLLGNGGVERKKDGTRITFYQEAIHIKYLLSLHNQLANAGYCNQIVPQIACSKKLGKKGKLYRTIRFAT